MTPIRDDVFGELDFRGYWSRDTELAFLGETLTAQLIVEGNDDEESIFDEQRTAYLQLSEMVAKAENAIFDYYQAIGSEHRPRFGDEAYSQMPTIARVTDLAQLVTLTGVVFPAVVDRGNFTVGFLLECAWEPEHGLGVKVTNDEVEVGTQDILT